LQSALTDTIDAQETCSTSLNHLVGGYQSSANVPISLEMFRLQTLTECFFRSHSGPKPEIMLVYITAIVSTSIKNSGCTKAAIASKVCAGIFSPTDSA